MDGIAQQFSVFLVAGVFTTLVDFTVYNLLTRRPLHWPRIRANCVSVSAAICFSFTVNLLFVFQPEVYQVGSRAVKFLAVTLFSAYGLQNLVIYLTGRVWLAPVNAALWLARRNRFTRTLEEDLIKRNTVKALAVSTGLVWNFLWYRYFVFTS